MERTFSKIPDVDAKILMNLNDKDLVSTCLTSKYANSICEKNSFWMNRYIKTFGQEAAKHKPDQRPWKQYYLQTIMDLETFLYRGQDYPMNFFENLVWDVKNSKGYFAIRDMSDFPQIVELLPFGHEEIPEWFMNYFWLKKFNVTINQGGNTKVENYQNITPSELVKKFPRRKYISQFREQAFLPGEYYPDNETSRINKVMKLQ